MTTALRRQGIDALKIKLYTKPLVCTFEPETYGLTEI